MFDPFGDFDTSGYLRNVVGEKDPGRIKQLEHRIFAQNIAPALEALQAVKQLRYEHVLATNKTLLGALYPWAGQDRATLAPGIAIGKGGHTDLFAHPGDVRRAVEHALDLGRDRATMRTRPGEVFGLLAYAHPLLETNGRTLMTVHADMTRRAGFHIAWPDIGKAEFITALTDELRAPGTALDQLLAPHIKAGPMASATTAARLGTNPTLNPDGVVPSTARRAGPSPGPDGLPPSILWIRADCWGLGGSIQHRPLLSYRIGPGRRAARRWRRRVIDAIEQCCAVVAHAVHRPADRPQVQQMVPGRAQQRRRVTLDLAKPDRPVLLLQHDRHARVQRRHRGVGGRGEDRKGAHRLAVRSPPALP